MTGRTRRRRVVLRARPLAAWLLCALGVRVSAQQPSWMAAPLTEVTSDATVGSAAEHTERILALLFGPSTEPGATRFDEAWLDRLRARALDSGLTIGSAQPDARITPIWVTSWINTTRTNPDQDGAVWQGRGVTASITGGGVLNWRFLSVSFRPLAFVTENANYAPPRVPDPAPNWYGDPYLNGRIDLPYRFGRGIDAALSPGESWVRLQAPHVGVGISSASQRWGPSQIAPLMLSTEGPGIPRLFADATDVPLAIGHISGEWIAARLEGSPYTGLPPGSRSRLATGMTGTFSFAGPLSGLSIGATRFFHIRWTRRNVNLDNLILPIRGLFKAGNPTGESEHGPQNFNQLASVFTRIAPPSTGVELYGELYREDHNADLRDLILEPDHESAYTLGLRRAWTSRVGLAPATVTSLTLETTNARITHLRRIRNEGPFYTHSVVREGHTYLGQPIGSLLALGGGGTTLLFDHLTDGAGTSVEAQVRRTAQNQEGGLWSDTVAARMGVRLAHSWRSGRMARGWSVGVDRGAGIERGTNLTLMLFVGARVERMPSDATPQ
jgi:hypothetical protein